MTDTPTKPRTAADVFFDLIVAFLAPMFLSVAGGDIDFARAAAIQTVNAYRAESHVDLLAVAQIIAFGLAALGSLSLAMADDLSPTMVMRLRANAVAANRASEQCRKALPQPRPDTASPVPSGPDDVLPDVAKIAAGLEQTRKAAANAQPQPAQPVLPSKPHAAIQQERRTSWAGAMANVAAEVASGIANLPPAQRREASLRAAALSSVANGLLAGRDDAFTPEINGLPPRPPA